MESFIHDDDFFLHSFNNKMSNKKVKMSNGPSRVQTCHKIGRTSMVNPTNHKRYKNVLKNGQWNFTFHPTRLKFYGELVKFLHNLLQQIYWSIKVHKSPEIFFIEIELICRENGNKMNEKYLITFFYCDQQIALIFMINPRPQSINLMPHQLPHFDWFTCNNQRGEL